MTEMTFTHSPMVCQACRHEWDQQMLQRAPVSVVVAHWKTLYCPKCGADWKRLAFVSRPEEESSHPPGGALTR
jgi:uncharacterized Zn ribbon protein